jgi:hypothetical protein
MRGAGAILIVLGACTFPEFGPPPSHLWLVVDQVSPLAVGSTTQLSVVNSQCGLFASGEACDPEPGDVLDERVAPAGVFEVARTGSRFEATAVAPGTAGFYVNVISGGQPVRLGDNLVAETIDSLSLPTWCESPALMSAGSEMSFDFEMWHGNDQLNGHIMPFTIVGAVLEPHTHGETWLRLPDTPGTVMITSPYVPDFTYEIDVIGPEPIDGIAFADPPSPLEVGFATQLHADLLVGTRPLCWARMPVAVSISTPDHCALAQGYDTSSDDIPIEGRAPGDCTVQVTLEGTDLSDTTTFTVVQ